MIKLLKSFLTSLTLEFIHGGHLFALGNSAIVLTILMLLSLPFNILLLSIPYFITQVIYTYNHVKELSSDENSNPERVVFLQKKKNRIKWQFIFYATSLIFVTVITNWATIFLVITMLSGGVLYSLYLKEFVSKKIVGLKNFYTCFFWTLIIFLVPSFYGLDVTPFFIFFFIFIFIRGVIGMAFSDIKDIDSDSVRGLKTFPVVFGKRNTIRMLYLLNIIAIIPLVVGIYLKYLPIESVFLCFSSLYGIYYLYRASSSRAKEIRVLSYILVDGEYIYWPILIFIGSILL